MPDPPGGDAHKALEEERHIMTAYSDTAKTYSQLSLGALVLSITFFEKVADTAGKIPVETPLVIAWSGWLVCTLAGAFYQYLAVRFLEAGGESWGVMTAHRPSSVVPLVGGSPLASLRASARRIRDRFCVFCVRRFSSSALVGTTVFGNILFGVDDCAPSLSLTSVQRIEHAVERGFRLVLHVEQ
jgi:hypothetical protein